ncbi:MAG: trigger factor [Chloroflexi bacterium]|nr:trigger factor [Chloroflexota bacterium]
MKISQKALDDHQIQFSVEVEAQTLESGLGISNRKIAQRVKIPGFRPGKAPYNVIEKQVGAQAIKDEALDIVLDDMYPRVIEEAGIKPYGPGTLEKVHEDKEPQVFEFRVPLSPEVKLGDYKVIRLPFEDKPLSAKDIENVLNNLREQNAVLQPVQRAAQEGDIAYILLSAERQTPKDGKTALLPERRYPVVIEKEDVDTKNEWPFPGFSRLLIGLKIGEEKTFPHTFSQDSEYEDLRGEASTFKLKVEEIKDRQLPDLDDSFAQSLGNYKNVSELRADIEKQLTENYKGQAEDEYENRIVEKIIADSEIKYPPQMLHHEIHHYIEDMGPDLAARGLDLETYLKSRQITHDQLEEEVSPRVEERLKKSLVIMEVSRQEKIEVPESEVQGLVEEKVKRLQQVLSAEDMRKLLAKDNLQGLVSRTLTEEVIRRTLARLRSIAQGQVTAEAKEINEIKEEKVTNE